jgi:hypothetical protein
MDLVQLGRSVLIELDNPTYPNFSVADIAALCSKVLHSLKSKLSKVSILYA